MKIQPYKESDRQKVLDLGNHPGAIDSAGSNCIVVEDGGEKGAAFWFWPGLIDPDIPTLGGITLSAAGRRDLYDALLLACCDAALAAGHKKGQAMALTEATLKVMRQTFKFIEMPRSTNTETGKPMEWDIEFDLAENRAILKGAKPWR